LAIKFIWIQKWPTRWERSRPQCFHWFDKKWLYLYTECF